MGPGGSDPQSPARASMTIDDIDIVEMNEAFAAQAKACRRELGKKKKKSRSGAIEYRWRRDRTSGTRWVRPEGG